jgi:hypothetical protein
VRLNSAIDDPSWSRGGLRLQGGATLVNTIVAENDPNGVEAFGEANALTNCTLASNSGYGQPGLGPVVGAHRISADPLFVAPPADFRLGPGSPDPPQGEERRGVLAARLRGRLRRRRLPLGLRRLDRGSLRPTHHHRLLALAAPLLTGPGGHSR